MHKSEVLGLFWLAFVLFETLKWELIVYVGRLMLEEELLLLHEKLELLMLLLKLALKNRLLVGMVEAGRVWWLECANLSIVYSVLMWLSITVLEHVWLTRHIWDDFDDWDKLFRGHFLMLNVGSVLSAFVSCLIWVLVWALILVHIHLSHQVLVFNLLTISVFLFFFNFMDYLLLLSPLLACLSLRVASKGRRLRSCWRACLIWMRHACKLRFKLLERVVRLRIEKLYDLVACIQRQEETLYQVNVLTLAFAYFWLLFTPGWGLIWVDHLFHFAGICSQCLLDLLCRWQAQELHLSHLLLLVELDPFDIHSKAWHFLFALAFRLSDLVLEFEHQLVDIADFADKRAIHIEKALTTFLLSLQGLTSLYLVCLRLFQFVLQRFEFVLVLKGLWFVLEDLLLELANLFLHECLSVDGYLVKACHSVRSRVTHYSLPTKFLALSRPSS